MTSRISLWAVLFVSLLPIGAQAQWRPQLPRYFRPPSVPRLHMQIVAHQDDDFLFMNPDLENNLGLGIGIVTVYLTAGEADGAGVMCRDEFATARQHGIQAAYAQMARRLNRGADVPNAWHRELIVPDQGVPWPHTAERYTLIAFPQIQLIFVNIKEDGDNAPPLNPLMNMLQYPAYVATTVVPSCGPVGTCVHSPSCGPDVPWQNYTHADVVNVLSGLVNMYQPDVIRTLDPQPFEKQGPPSNLCGEPGYDVCYDNLDHTATARFTDEVLANYHGPNGSGRHSVIHYKGYSFVDYPPNLGIEDSTNKRNVAFVYRPYDPNYQNSNYEAYYHVMYERYPGSTKWIEKSLDGRLVAVSVENREVKLWSENTVGGSWSGPTSLNSGRPIAPHVTLLRRGDGRLQIFALRLPLERERWAPPPTAPYQEVITAIQIPGTMTFGSWHSIGSPDRGQFVGVATAVADGAPDGRHHLFAFAKNSDGKVAYAHANADDNIWSSWSVIDPTSQDIIDGIAAIARDDGNVEVFATSRAGYIQHFVQSGIHFSPDRCFPFGDAASAPTVTKNQDGRLQIFYREAVNSPTQYGRVLTAWMSRSGQWVGSPPDNALYGDAGVGPVAAIRRDGTGHIMLFERNTWGGISATGQIQPNDVFVLQWQVLGGLWEEYAAATTDGLGRVVVMAKGSDNRLYMQREISAADVGHFSQWTQVGD